MDFLCEHVVDRKKEGLYRFTKPFIASLWIFIPLLIIAIGFTIAGALGGGGVLGYATIFVIPLTAFLAGKFGPATMAFGDVAYEYCVASGEMSFAKIFGNRFRKEWFSLKVSNMEKCAPYNENVKRELDGMNFDRVYNATSSLDAPNVYYAIFKNSKDEYCLMYFEVIKKSFKLIRTYFPGAVSSNLPF